MHRIKSQVNSNILLTIYNSLILSQLHYGILCWGFYGKKLFKMQKKAVRVIAHEKYNAHTDPIFKKYKLLKLDDIFKLQCLKFYYRYRNGNIPEYFLKNCHFTQCSEVHDYNLRNQLFRQAEVNRHTTRKNLRHFIPTLINETPRNILQIISSYSLDSVKKHIKAMYLDQYETQCTKVQCYVCSR